MILAAKHETPWTDQEPQTNARNAYARATHSLNRLTGLTNTDSGSFGFGYDALGRRTSLTRPNGVNTSYSYDTLSRLLGGGKRGQKVSGTVFFKNDVVECRHGQSPAG